MGGPRLTQRQKQTAFRYASEGGLLEDIAHQLDCDLSCVSLVVRSRRNPVGVSDPWTPRTGQLSVDERERILTGSGASRVAQLDRQITRPLAFDRHP